MLVNLKTELNDKAAAQYPRNMPACENGAFRVGNSIKDALLPSYTALEAGERADSLVWVMRISANEHRGQETERCVPSQLGP